MTRVRRVVLPLALPVALLAAWWVLSAGSSSPYFPPLSDIVRAFLDTWVFEQAAADLLPSLTRLAIGFAIAIAIGVGLGTLLGLSPRTRRDVQLVTELCRATPIAALVPLGLVLLGPGTRMEIVLIAFGSCWPILVATTDGVRGVDPLALDVARVYRLSAVARIRHVVLPAALPRIMAGLRIALTLAIATMVIANMFGSNAGLGYSVLTAQQSFDIPGTWAGLFMIGLVGCAANLVLVAVQHRTLAWHRGWRASARGGTA